MVFVSTSQSSATYKRVWFSGWKSEWVQYIINNDLVYKEITQTEFAPVNNITFHYARYFIIGKMVSVYVDFSVLEGFEFSKETMISSSVFPKALKLVYSYIPDGYCFINANSGELFVYARTEGRYFINFTYPIA